MGRSAKIVRTSAFEKQKRIQNGRDWKKSQWKEARETEKKQKREAEDKKADVKNASAASDKKQEALDKKVKNAVTFMDLASLSSGGFANLGADTDMDMDDGDAEPASKPSASKKKGKAKAKKKV
eukprot:TRINITY_DN7092_c0_g1_i5.p2 TRINITY_DN7092_c0_g1~~TRINITY_DN7092_c0_g1_i5.p2  ORF type:complete len:124 (+),score=50.99 TRINITY_DN7092_c0_g1_i5:363-734(+)